MRVEYYDASSVMRYDPRRLLGAIFRFNNSVFKVVDVRDAHDRSAAHDETRDASDGAVMVSRYNQEDQRWIRSTRATPRQVEALFSMQNSLDSYALYNSKHYSQDGYSFFYNAGIIRRVNQRSMSSFCTMSNVRHYSPALLTMRGSEFGPDAPMDAISFESGMVRTNAIDESGIARAMLGAYNTLDNIKSLMRYIANNGAGSNFSTALAPGVMMYAVDRNTWWLIVRTNRGDNEYVRWPLNITYNGEALVVPRNERFNQAASIITQLYGADSITRG